VLVLGLANIYCDFNWADFFVICGVEHFIQLVFHKVLGDLPFNTRS
jgi:hypothetical protein